ncbi:hypothetical protein NC651_017894 [Populus alba x Populus x berolinensis]|nr:hypothetical protein NC651_017894 [Populus alba x Populus x berolinensis]
MLLKWKLEKVVGCKLVLKKQEDNCHINDKEKCTNLFSFPNSQFPPESPTSSLSLPVGYSRVQTGLSLYVDAFIPDGCHKLLDVVSGVEGSTKCELEDSRLRVVAILDLVFVVLIVMVTYGVIAKSYRVRRLGGSYEALPTAASLVTDSSSNHIQMKALTGTQA